MEPGESHGTQGVYGRIINEVRATTSLAARQWVGIALSVFRHTKHVVRLTRATGRMLTTFKFSLGLHIGYQHQGGVESLVLDKTGSIDRAQLIEGPVGQGRMLVPNL